MSSGKLLTLAGALALGAGVHATDAVSASGGDVSLSPGYRIHTFTSNGTFTVTAGGTVDILLVGGGGGGGVASGGGGGGGANGDYHGAGGAGGSGIVIIRYHHPITGLMLLVQ